MLSSLSAARRVAVGAVGACAVAGAMLFGATPAAPAADAAPTITHIAPMPARGGPAGVGGHGGGSGGHGGGFGGPGGGFGRGGWGHGGYGPAGWGEAATAAVAGAGVTAVGGATAATPVGEMAVSAHQDWVIGPGASEARAGATKAGGGDPSQLRGQASPASCA